MVINKLRSSIAIFAIVVTVTFVVIVERRNSKSLFIPVTVERTAENRQEIAIVVIVADNKKAEEYVLARSTLRCYAQAHDYVMLEVNLKENYTDVCPGHDFYFRRHCVLTKIMNEYSQIEWFLFLDADAGVVNPNHLIEEYTNREADMIFYNRLWNYEITSGSYLARNSAFSRDFLRHWSSYEHKVKLGTKHGTDKGALHEVFLDFFCSTCAPRRRSECIELWHNSHTLSDLLHYESCAREILGPAEWFRSGNGTVRQLSLGRGYWSRDAFLTDSKWSDDDFMIHGWKEIRRNEQWKNVFAGESLDPSNCNSTSTMHLSFAYNSEFRTEVNVTRTLILKAGFESYRKHVDRLKDISRIQVREMSNK
ncbi:hypothetical protein M3Y98_00703700 [Aphelenchoides besseyi]|nr:hypothetical protein M3Y98_00703700 [Aphelenchoides besseyi]